MVNLVWCAIPLCVLYTSMPYTLVYTIYAIHLDIHHIYHTAWYTPSLSHHSSHSQHLTPCMNRGYLMKHVISMCLEVRGACGERQWIHRIYNKLYGLVWGRLLRCMILSTWCMMLGVWYMLGVWCSVCGVWCMTWCMVYGMMHGAWYILQRLWSPRDKTQNSADAEGRYTSFRCLLNRRCVCVCWCVCADVCVDVCR